MPYTEKETYEDVLEDAEPYDEDRPTNPLEVYVMEREQRRHPQFNIGDPPTSHLFIVLDHEHEEVAHKGRRTTPGSHHNRYDSAKDRAFGFISGYEYARSEHKRIEVDFDEAIEQEMNEPTEWIWQSGE